MGMFGLSTKKEDSRLLLLPVPWEVTTSYGAGASKGPDCVLHSSPQLDLYDLKMGEFYKQGIHLMPEGIGQRLKNEKFKTLAQEVITAWDQNGELNESECNKLDKINAACEHMVDQVYLQSRQLIEEGYLVGVLGGDHSSPLGLIKALCEKHPGEIGILHIDAHADLRLAYQGFKYSHASIMRNVLQLKPGIKNLVQVGIRDFCIEEFDVIKKHDSTIDCHFDRKLKEQLYSGTPWSNLSNRIVSSLPDKVYISFDIDGLLPEFCPGTGTPVPGGLSFNEAQHLIDKLTESGKEVVGFDLCEVAPDNDPEWNGNVGARVLFQLAGCALATGK